MAIIRVCDVNLLEKDLVDPISNKTLIQNITRGA